jgi:hypothetical protein
MGVPQRNGYRAKHSRTSRRGAEAFRAIRGLTIVAIGVMALLLFGKTLFRNNGVIVPFGGGALAPWPLQRPEPAPAVTGASLPELQSHSIYRCFVDGRLVYSGPEDCSLAQRAPTFRTAAPEERTSTTTQPDGLTEYQRGMLRSADARIAREAAAARAEMEFARRNAAAVRTDCDALEQEIRSLDAWARQPNDAATQDTIRARRQNVRSRQAAQRC